MFVAEELAENLEKLRERETKLLAIGVGDSLPAEIAQEVEAIRAHRLALLHPARAEEFI